ncbi:MAG: hypothetical protein Q8K63_05515, partial [Acidimicrobiales bacterium]|nr:hypothetical protein [Acidimicrobiales bacterium]
MALPSVRYPAAPRVDVVDDYHGTLVPDPYRWMEDPENPDLKQWLADQDAICQSWLDAVAHKATWRAAQARLLPGAISPPAVRGERLFFHRRAPGEQHAKFVVREADGTERILFDPTAVDASGLTTLDVATVSPDGACVVVGVSSGGDEDTAISVFDVATLERLDGPIERTRYTAIAWMPSGNEFFYVRRLTPEPFNRRVFRHVIGQPITSDVLVFGEGRDPSTYYGLDISLDGDWLAITAAVGTEPRNDLYLYDVTTGAAPVALAEGLDAQHWAHFVHGRIFVNTTLDAPKGRMVEVLDPAAGPSAWRTVLPEHDTAVIDEVATVEEGFLISRSDHAVSEVIVASYDGGDLKVVALPGAGTAMISGRYDHGSGGFVTYTDFVSAPTVYALDTSTGATSEWATTPGARPAS